MKKEKDEPLKHGVTSPVGIADGPSFPVDKPPSKLPVSVPHHRGSRETIFRTIENDLGHHHFGKVSGDLVIGSVDPLGWDIGEAVTNACVEIVGGHGSRTVAASPASLNALSE